MRFPGATLSWLVLGASLAATGAAPPAADPLGALRPLYERLFVLPAVVAALVAGWWLFLRGPGAAVAHR